MGSTRVVSSPAANPVTGHRLTIMIKQRITEIKDVFFILIDLSVSYGLHGSLINYYTPKWGIRQWGKEGAHLWCAMNYLLRKCDILLRKVKFPSEVKYFASQNAMVWRPHATFYNGWVA